MSNYIGLMECFKDTQRQIKENPKLAKRTKKMQAGTRLYLEKFTSIEAGMREKEPEIEVLEDTTFHCASRYVRENKKIAVLNFANAYHPGGGVVQGAMAQEECLCRSSNLYEGLTIPYIVRHYYKWNQKNTGDMFSDRIIYTPGVTVFKDDSDYPVNMEEWFEVDVITCAAPYNDPQKRARNTEEKLKAVFYHRIQNILEVAIANKVDILILGAFGCGAFHNSATLVANVMCELLVEKEYARYFERVVFAIKKSGSNNTNYLAFKMMFAEVDKKTLAEESKNERIINTSFQVEKENNILVWNATFGEEICTVSSQAAMGTSFSEVLIIYDDLELYSKFDMASTLLPGLKRPIMDAQEKQVGALKWFGEKEYELTYENEKVKIMVDKGKYEAYLGGEKVFFMSSYVDKHEINYLESVPKAILSCLFAFPLMRFGF